MARRRTVRSMSFKPGMGKSRMPAIKQARRGAFKGLKGTGGKGTKGAC